jgi:hypothetical protein
MKGYGHFVGVSNVHFDKVHREECIRSKLSNKTGRIAKSSHVLGMMVESYGFIALFRFV